MKSLLQGLGIFWTLVLLAIHADIVPAATPIVPVATSGQTQLHGSVVTHHAAQAMPVAVAERAQHQSPLVLPTDCKTRTRHKLHAIESTRGAVVALDRPVLGFWACGPPSAA